MLKKILLSCLAATVTISMPLSANAAKKFPEIKPIAIPGLSAKQESLSAADRKAIDKLIQNMVKSANDGNPALYMKSYSTKYQGAVEGSEKVSTYEELQQGKSFISLLKAMGIQFKTENIVLNGNGKNRAIAEITYRVSAKESSPIQDGKRRTNSWKVVTGLEKINGRWLVVSEYTMKPTGADSPTFASQPTPLKNITERDRQVFSTFFKRHLETLNKKDLNGYLATLDQQAPLYKQAKADTAQLFQEYTLKYSMQSVKVLSIGSTEAVVEMVATVKKVSGGEFQDSKMTTTNVLRKVNGKWRIYDTSVNSLESLQAKK